jgi:uncharacterized protein
MGRHLLFVATIGFLVPAVSEGQIVSMYPDTGPQISVNGVGSIDVQPDIATVLLGVFAVDRDLAKAKAVADASVRRLLQLTESLAIATPDVLSSSLSIEPQYSEGPKREFIGYEVSRSVTVTLRDLALLDRLVDQAIQAGANREFDVTLKSSRERDLREQALTLAIEDAKTQAARLATGFGARLGPVRTIRPGDRGGTGLAVASIVVQGVGTFRPGTLRFEATLSVTFSLLPGQ